MMVSSPGMLGGELAMGRGGDLLFAGMGAGGEPQRARADLSAQAPQLRLIDRQRRAGRLQIADRRNIASAEPAQTLGLRLVLRQALRERGEHRADQPRPPPPAPVRALRQPAVHQHHRDAAGMRRQHQIRPQLGFDPERQIGLPMIEKPLDPGGQVERHELMARPRRQPLFEQSGRGHGPGGHQDLELGPGLQQQFDQPQHRRRLADARRVNPDERPGRPRRARKTLAFAQTRPVFLAPPLAVPQV